MCHEFLEITGHKRFFNGHAIKMKKKSLDEKYISTIFVDLY